MSHILIVLLTLAQAPALAVQAPEYAPANPEWNRPMAPFRIAGNLYYVGASDVSAFLIATPDGHILVDAGFRETAPQVEANITALGFDPRDVRLLLPSHGHYDHAGGLARLKARTGARVLANPIEAALLARGGTGDFAFGDTVPYPRVDVDGSLRDGEQVRLGGTTMTARFTPGHTMGCTTWTTEVVDAGHTLRVVIPCSLSAPGYHLLDNPKYPRIVEDYEASLAALRALPCDVFLGGHSWDFDLHGKVRARSAAATENPFVDPEGYRRYLDRAEAALRKQTEAERRALK